MIEPDGVAIEPPFRTASAVAAGATGPADVSAEVLENVNAPPGPALNVPPLVFGPMTLLELTPPQQIDGMVMCHAEQPG